MTARPDAVLTRRSLLAASAAGLLGVGLSSCLPAAPPPEHAADAEPTLAELVERHRRLGLVDAHNHDAASGVGPARFEQWDELGLAGVVLFGSVSEPRAVADDERTWAAFEARPDVVIPFFSGIDLRDPAGVDAARARLEQGFIGLGEIAAASAHSEALADVAWKTRHPMDGALPRIYDVCAEFRAPVLLHVDPLSGVALDRLEEALETHPATTFILAHANAHSSPAAVGGLLERHANLVVDYFAGFDDRGPVSALADYVPLARTFPDRWVLGSDSGFGLASEAAAIESMYRFLDLLGDDEVAARVASGTIRELVAARLAA